MLSFSVVSPGCACAVAQHGDLHVGWLAPEPAGPWCHTILNALRGF